MTETIVALLALAGGGFTFIAGLGVVNLPDILNRMHASTKAGTLGSALTLAGTAVYFAEGSVIARVVAIILFLLMTAPIAAHMIGRAAFRAEENKRIWAFFDH